MFKKTLFILSYVILILLLMNFFSSCFSTSHHRRGKLSDAMEKASDESEDREVDTEPDHEPEYYYEEEDDEEYVYQSFSDDTSTQGYEQRHPEVIDTELESSPTWFSLKGGTGIIKGKNFFGFNHFNIALGKFPIPQHRIEFNAGFALAPLQQTSILKKSLDGGVTLLNLGFNYKWFTTLQHTFMGQYFSFGLKYNYMIWKYKNPILADTYDEWGNVTGTEKITYDRLSGFEFYSGVGFHVLQVEAIQIGGEIAPGVIFWFGETSEGFENDVFSTFWYMKFKVLVNLKFN